MEHHLYIQGKGQWEMSSSGKSNLGLALPGSAAAPEPVEWVLLHVQVGKLFRERERQSSRGR